MRVLVTGAASGIGRATCVRLARDAKAAGRVAGVAAVDVASPAQLDGLVAVRLEPNGSGGHGMKRGAADRRELETPRRLCVDMGEHRSGDSGEIEHVRERIHPRRR